MWASMVADVGRRLVNWGPFQGAAGDNEDRVLFQDLEGNSPLRTKKVLRYDDKLAKAVGSVIGGPALRVVTRGG
jgi:uncharacterized membrane protein